MLRTSMIVLGLLSVLSFPPTGASACPAADARFALSELDAALAKAAPNEPARAKGLRDLALKQISDRDYKAASRTLERARRALGITETADDGESAPPQGHLSLPHC